MAIRSAPANVDAENGPDSSVDLRQLRRQRLRVRWRGARVGDADVRAMARKPARERQPGESETEHDDVAAFEVHVSAVSSVERPNSTSSIVMIQNRTTTWFSFQPASS